MVAPMPLLINFATKCHLVFVLTQEKAILSNIGFILKPTERT